MTKTGIAFLTKCIGKDKIAQKRRGRLYFGDGI
jgi:hypothetical protein